MKLRFVPFLNKVPTYRQVAFEMRPIRTMVLVQPNSLPKLALDTEYMVSNHQKIFVAWCFDQFYFHPMDQHSLIAIRNLLFYHYEARNPVHSIKSRCVFVLPNLLADLEVPQWELQVNFIKT